MFRQGWSRKKLAPGGKVELHPLLEQINPLGWDIGQIEPYVSHRTLGNALDLPVANELVTSPCTEELEVDFLIGFSCAVRRKKGVRIRDALKLFRIFGPNQSFKEWLSTSGRIMPTLWAGLTKFPSLAATCSSTTTAGTAGKSPL